jgi:hypothetical protein
MARVGRFTLTIDEAAELHISLKVVRQGGEQHLTGYLRCRAASKLPQPTFAFDPSVRKLCHSCALAIYLLCLGGAHPFIEPSNGHLVLRDGDFASSLFQFTLPAASLPRRTHVAFFFTSYVHADGAAGLAVEVLKAEALVLWTDHLI